MFFRATDRLSFPVLRPGKSSMKEELRLEPRVMCSLSQADAVAEVHVDVGKVVLHQDRRGFLL